MLTEKVQIASPAPLQGLAQLIDSYDFFMIDIWGVLHDGHTLYPKAVAFLHALKKRGKQAFLLSNAPRRLEAAQDRLESMGLARNAYTGIYTSGEDCHRRLRDRDTPLYQTLGQNLYHIGPERDKNLFSELSYVEVSTIAEADFVLNTGIKEWDETVTDYVDILATAHDRELTMICANPDKVVHRGGQEIACAGALGAAYEAQGGSVWYHGKPYLEIYERLFNAIKGGVDRSRALAIGDSLTTDIKGAANAGVDSVLIMSGIHTNELGKNTTETVASLCAQKGSWPTYTAPILTL